MSIPRIWACCANTIALGKEQKSIPFMKKQLLALVALLSTAMLSSAQNNVGIGTISPDSTAILDVKSSSKGFLIPRMTRAQRLAIQNPADGLQVFQTDTLQGIYTYFQNYQGWFIQTIQKDIGPVPHKQKFTYPNLLQKFIVPPGVKFLKITVDGAAGGGATFIDGGGNTAARPGGLGLGVSGLLTVNPGDSLIIKLGTKGNTPGAGSPGATAGETVNYTVYLPFLVGWVPSNATTVTGGGGGSTSIFLNDTIPANLLVRSIGGIGGNFPPYTWFPYQSGGSSGTITFTPGTGGGPQFIAGSVQNPAVTVGATDSASVTIEWNTPTYIITGNGSGSSQEGVTTPVANANTTGLLSFTDWNTFSNKVGGAGNTNELAFFNGTKTLASSGSLKWDNANTRLEVNNVKVNSLAGPTTQLVAADSTGKLIISGFSPSGDNMGNHTAFQTLNLNNNFISNNATKLGLKLDNNGYAAIGLDSTATGIPSPLTVNSPNGIWIASNVGAKTGDRVISGLFNGMATIGAHNNGLTAWANFKISPIGNVAIGDITPLVKLDVSGTLRATNIGIGTTTPQRAVDIRGDIAFGTWTDNIPFRRIGVMNSTTQVAGMEIENTALGGSYSQKLHFLTHHFGATFDRRLTIDEDGNVGIGTTTPANKLSVQGNANITGTLSTSGNTTIGGALSVNSITSTGVLSITPSANVTGTVTAGNFTTAGTVTAATVNATNIVSPKFKVTEIWNSVQNIPPVTNFTTSGGTVMLNIAAMAFQTTGNPATLTINVVVDGNIVTTLKGFASQNSSQIPLTANFKVITGLAAGNHTISIVPVLPTQIDGNSYISASLLELPF